MFHLFPLIDSIFPDQGGYYDNIKTYRENYDFDSLRHSNQNKYLSIILSIVPIPSIGSIYSATFINKFIIIFFIIYLIKLKYVSNTQAIILLIYPSLFFIFELNR